MNATYIIAFESRSQKKAQKATEVCLDWGLEKALKNVYIGSLKPHELRKLKGALVSILCSKTDVFVVFPVCKKCLDSGGLSREVIFPKGFQML